MSPAERLAAELREAGVEAFTAPDYRPGEVVHIVLFRFGAAVTEAERDTAKVRFLALGTECRRAGEAYIRDVAAGEPNGGEGAERGFEQGFVLRFGSEGDRNFYVGTPVVSDPAHCDPAHHAFKMLVGPLLEPGPGGVLVFDIATGRP